MVNPTAGAGVGGERMSKCVAWIIETGGERWREKAGTFREAVTQAFKRRPPKNTGLLVQGRPLGTNPDETTVYCEAEVCLGWAGHRVSARG